MGTTCVTREWERVSEKFTAIPLSPSLCFGSDRKRKYNCCLICVGNGGIFYITEPPATFIFKTALEGVSFLFPVVLLMS